MIGPHRVWERDKWLNKWLGSVSEGTLKAEDLIPTYLSVLEGLVEETSDQYKADDFSKLQGKLLRRMKEEFAEATDLWYDTNEAIEFQCELADAINDHCASGVYFGSHEGDGACIGFWLGEDETLSENTEDYWVGYLKALADTGRDLQERLDKARDQIRKKFGVEATDGIEDHDHFAPEDVSNEVLTRCQKSNGDCLPGWFDPHFDRDKKDS